MIQMEEMPEMEAGGGFDDMPLPPQPEVAEGAAMNVTGGGGW